MQLRLQDTSTIQLAAVTRGMFLKVDVYSLALLLSRPVQPPPPCQRYHSRPSNSQHWQIQPSPRHDILPMGVRLAALAASITKAATSLRRAVRIQASPHLSCRKCGRY